MEEKEMTITNKAETLKCSNFGVEDIDFTIARGHDIMTIFNGVDNVEDFYYRVSTSTTPIVKMLNKVKNYVPRLKSDVLVSPYKTLKYLSNYFYYLISVCEIDTICKLGKEPELLADYEESLGIIAKEIEPNSCNCKIKEATVYLIASFTDLIEGVIKVVEEKANKVYMLKDFTGLEAKCFDKGGVYAIDLSNTDFYLNKEKGTSVMKTVNPYTNDREFVKVKHNGEEDDFDIEKASMYLLLKSMFGNKAVTLVQTVCAELEKSVEKKEKVEKNNDSNTNPNEITWGPAHREETDTEPKANPNAEPSNDTKAESDPFDEDEFK